MKKFKKFFTLLICLLPIFRLKNFILNYLGHNISLKSKIGFSIIFVDKILMNNKSKIGNFNFININKVKLFKNSRIQNFNVFKGNFTIKLIENSVIKNFNTFTRGNFFNGTCISYLYLGEKSQITSFSNIDLADSILVSNNTVLAGKGIQLWSHGFYHDNSKKRHLIVGKIKIGTNVYVASRVVINPSVTIKDNINIGINSAITQNLNDPGIYFPAKNNLINYTFEKKKYKSYKFSNFEYLKKRK